MALSTGCKSLDITEPTVNSLRHEHPCSLLFFLNEQISLQIKAFLIYEKLTRCSTSYLGWCSAIELRPQQYHKSYHIIRNCQKKFVLAAARKANRSLGGKLANDPIKQVLIWERSQTVPVMNPARQHIGIFLDPAEACGMGN